MVTVIPAIIPKNREQLENEMKIVKNFASFVQIDISDGLFTQVKTWPYNGRDTDFFEKLVAEESGWPYWQDIDVEVHLMVKHPEDVVEKWINSGVSSVVAHIEATDDFQAVIDVCRAHSVAIGVAIKPSTLISRITPFISQVDFIQCMGSDNLGHHGVEMDSGVFDRIKQLHAQFPNSIIGIDIGVTQDSAEELISAGATRLITGSAILESHSPEEIFHYLSSLHE